MPIINPAIPALQKQSGDVAFAKYIAIAWQTIVIIGGLTTLVYLAWGALDMIFTSDNVDRFTRAKQKIFNSLFGLIFLVLSYAIIKLVSTVTGLKILNPAWPTL